MRPGRSQRFGTLGYRVRHYLPRLLDMGRWRRMLGPRQDASKISDPEPVFAVAPSPRAVVRADFADMLDRGLKLCLIYSGGISNYFNHARQFRECFGRVMSRPGVSTGFLPECDHTYILTGDRDRMHVLRTGTKANQDEMLATGLLAEQGHRIVDVTADLLVARLRFTAGGAVAEGRKVEPYRRVTERIEPAGHLHMQAERPDPMDQTGIEHHHANVADRSSADGNAGDADQMPRATEAEGLLAHHATSRTWPVTAWISG